MFDCDLRYKIGFRSDNEHTTLTWSSNQLSRIKRQFKQFCSYRYATGGPDVIKVCVNNVSVKSKLQHAPPGIPRAFDTFAVPGRREFDYQSLLGGGEFDPHALGVGNLN